MKTIRRDKLLRLAKAGKLVSVGSYHFDDMMGESRGEKRLPVFVAQPGEFKEGFCHLREHHFETGCGRAWLNEDRKQACLYVHSNCNFDLEMADGSTF